VNGSLPVLFEVAPENWHGTLHLEFANWNGVTQLIHNAGRAPLRVQRPLYPEGEQVCHTAIVHTAGGVVGGDRLTLNLRLQPEAQALITTPAAAKVYRTNGNEACQQVWIDVAEGACLEWLPQEAIVFDGALYRQAMRVNLAPGAHWLGWEVTRFGRTARGESFTQGSWRSQTEVWQAGKPVWIDRQWLPGDQDLFMSPHGLAGCPVVGSFAWIGQSVEPEFVEKMRSLWQGTGEVGVTRLPVGLLCRYRGQSSVEARRWFVEVWGTVRSQFFERAPHVPRIWGV
jgi:urease accessory protein